MLSTSQKIKRMYEPLSRKVGISILTNDDKIRLVTPSEVEEIETPELTYKGNFVPIQEVDIEELRGQLLSKSL